MDDAARKQTEDAMSRMLALSREIPKRPTSPWGNLSIDNERIMADARIAYEALRRSLDNLVAPES